ncbi:MAG: vWA domain-containing protein [Gammaproteobacteria bacterium]|nr:vWA domain-containing protein [Gammaproteobacteria bacterium]
MTKKFIFENGVMKKNPAYNEAGPSTVANPKQALAIVSSVNDINDATQTQYQATGKPMQMSEATQASIEIMQDRSYLDQFEAKGELDGGDLLEGLSNIFAKYEVPIGLVNKLLALSEYELNFLIDDSGSMTEPSDALIKEASPQMREKFRNKQDNYVNTMTRWEEAEDRLHVMFDMLAYIPINKITFRFLNRNNDLVLTHAGKTPDQFAQEAHQKISAIFKKQPGGQTPAYQKLSQAFQQARSNTMHYFFTDGEPSDASTDQMKQLVMQRQNPAMNPLTFISCTNNDEQSNWMKEIEEAAPFCSELDDFNSERKEVLNDQGPAFPFSKGFWLIRQLVDAINPLDLDKMDESVPYTKQTMNNLLGRRLTDQDYHHYFSNNPNAQKKYRHLEREFAREDIMAHQIAGVNQASNNSSNSGFLAQFGFNRNNQQQQQQQQYYSNQSDIPPPPYSYN